jgi:hypothetical protein
MWLTADLTGTPDQTRQLPYPRLPANWLPWMRPGIDARIGPDAALHGALTAGREQILADPTAVPRGT